ncbi:hypothetical protein [Streptomyces sp. NPDC094049]|uniref:hypothetical protein n=1 Tax=Streptomyces sp. NPDC094049 TaxID=3154987 RepID=UPI00331F9B74
MSLAPAVQASGCRCYTSWFTGPNGQTTGSGEHPEGGRGPECRICENGWWVFPRQDGDRASFGF